MEPYMDESVKIVHEKQRENHHMVKEKPECEDESERRKVTEQSEKKGASEKKEHKKKDKGSKTNEKSGDVKNKETVKKGKENKETRREQKVLTDEGTQPGKEKKREEKRAEREERQSTDEKIRDKTEKRDPLKLKDKKSIKEKKSKEHSHKDKIKSQNREKHTMEDNKLSNEHKKFRATEGEKEVGDTLHTVKCEVDWDLKENGGMTVEEKVSQRVKSFEEELDEMDQITKKCNKLKKKEKDLKKGEKKEKNKEPKSDKNEFKGIKREIEDKEEIESSSVKKKVKLESEKDDRRKDKKPDRKKSSKDNEENDFAEKKDKGSRKRKNQDTKATNKKKVKGDIKKEEDSKWKWWEEEHYEDGVKWKFLEHKGPYFAPPYEPLPDDVNFYYDGKPMKLSPEAEEVATFFAKMLDHEYTTKEVFQKNFFADWKPQMTSEERKLIKHTCISVILRDAQKLKEEANKIQEEYGFCTLDGHREKIGNFKTEPPGLFRGRGDHPKMGMLKMRIMPEDVIINCSKESKAPEPPAGHKWKEVRCDNTVTWLASWTENIQNSIKYIMLNPSSKLKGEKDWQKYETARRLKSVVGEIRAQYRQDWKSREMKKRQRAVAMYFIDKLALRAGNEKEEGETADTVGCCSLRVEHIQLHPELDGQQYVVEFDFLGKDSIRYYNKVPVEKEVFKNLKLFMENKNPDDELFDRLSTTSLNKHLQDLMDGLTAKVFRTYNASITLQIQLKELSNGDDNVAAKILSYNRANRAVALLCNHQRAPPKTYEKSMQNLQTKIDAKEQQLKEAKKELKKAKAEHKERSNEKTKKEVEKKKKQFSRIEEQLMKLKLQATDKEENKQIALGTSKLNYLDPRITVAWCKKFGVPIEKIYNKTQREKFAWAIDMTDEDFEF
ncbi:hypothetical protein GDO86_018106 [Hymenochirus boettgeri]|uniref:DNA topoisomerase I n=1 Tax=Hymenochirus boettgeri TaxID=247094 RepID=A0A8T2IKE4_9PIPI|nr:hypothetical protein GDO86_018106 [Hymenochirus boettgeri]